MMRLLIEKIKAQSEISTGVLFLIVGSSIYLLSYSQAPGTSDWSLSPGFFPRLAAAFIIGLSLLHVLISLKEGAKPKRTKTESRRPANKIVFITLAVSIIYPYFMEYLGFLGASFVSISLLMRVYGHTKWVPNILLSLSIPLVVYYLAFKLMYIVFPTGKLIELMF